MTKILNIVFYAVLKEQVLILSNDTRSAYAEEYSSINQIADLDGRASGDDGLKVTPVPIPNTKVKLQSADSTAGEALWEGR